MFVGIFKVQLKNALAYRAQFMFSLLLFPIRFFVMYFIWTALFLNNSGKLIGGYTLNELIFYFVFNTFIFALIWNDIPHDIENLIRNGDFVQHLLRPIQFTYYSFVNLVSHRFLALIIEITPLLIIFMVFFKNYFIVGNVLFFLIFLILAFLFSYLFGMGIGLLAFWFVKIRTFSWSFAIFKDFASGLILPLTIFPPILFNIFDVLPFKFMAFVPLQVYLNKFTQVEIYNLLILAIIWLVIISVIVYFIWMQAQKRYCGEGT